MQTVSVKADAEAMRVGSSIRAISSKIPFFSILPRVTFFADISGNFDHATFDDIGQIAGIAFCKDCFSRLISGRFEFVSFCWRHRLLIFLSELFVEHTRQSGGVSVS